MDCLIFLPFPWRISTKPGAMKLLTGVAWVGEELTEPRRSGSDPASLFNDGHDALSLAYCANPRIYKNINVHIDYNSLTNF